MHWIKKIFLYVMSHTWLSNLLKILLCLTFIALGLGLGIAIDYYYLIFAIVGFILGWWFFGRKKQYWKDFKEKEIPLTKIIIQDEEEDKDARKK